MRKRTNEGRCEGRKPYGFYDGEAAVIERMKALRAEGLGYDRIAAQMNADGLATRTRGRWHGVMVNRILSAQGARKEAK
jgi:site-specific DNA recombinase